MVSRVTGPWEDRTAPYNESQLCLNMKILISNDDGYQAPGIVALFEALKDLAEVEVVAPEQNNSAKSNALTLNTPMYVTCAANGFRYINGTPADCVHVALTGLLGHRTLPLAVDCAQPSGRGFHQRVCSDGESDRPHFQVQPPVRASTPATTSSYVPVIGIAMR